jgi:hypothetical protein
MPDDQVTKLCPGCGQRLSLSEFGPRPERGPIAVRPRCRTCRNTARKRRRAEVSPEEQARALELARQWKRSNPDRVREKKRAWDAANPEKVSAHKKKQGAKWRAANRRLAVARSLASRAKNPERFRAYNRQWQRDNTPRCRAKYKAYMARKVRAMPVWADQDLIEHFYRLAQKLGRETGQEHHVDHIVPLQGKTVCGLHVHDNLQVLPGKLNLSKGNRYWPDMP